jgi:hypothetical protein
MTWPQAPNCEFVSALRPSVAALGWQNGPVLALDYL